MRNLPLNALRAFAAVHISGGIRPAGRMLGVSHSSVARHLAHLEAHVGAPLVEPHDHARALAFTPLGERLGREAAKALGSLDRTWIAARERRPANAVMISAAPSFAALWLLPRLPRLAATHPQIEVSVLAEQRVRASSEEGSDLSIRMGAPRKGERAVPLMDDALTPVASPRLLAKARAARGGVTGGVAVAALLRDLPLLHDRDPNAGWSIWTERHGPSDADLAFGPRFSSSDLVLRAAKLEQGVTLARLQLAADDLASGALERLSEAEVLLPDAYSIVERDDADRASVRAVRDWLIAEGKASVAC
ncbi:MAG: LysR substrate-binding domain-containing protein [Pseudomonadota bacterium]